MTTPPTEARAANPFDAVVIGLARNARGCCVLCGKPFEDDDTDPTELAHASCAAGEYETIRCQTINEDR